MTKHCSETKKVVSNSLSKLLVSDNVPLHCAKALSNKEQVA